MQLPTTARVSSPPGSVLGQDVGTSTAEPGWPGLLPALGHLAAVATQVRACDIAGAMASCWVHLAGAVSVRMWLVDHQHRLLHDVTTAGPGADEALSVRGGSEAASAFRSLAVTRRAGRIHVPLQLRGYRLGVAELEASDLQLADHEWALVGATMAGALQAAAETSDLWELQRRSFDFSVEAERQWSMLPPMEQHHSGIWVGGLIEPAHTATSDLFDWAVADDCVWACLIEGSGARTPAADTTLALAAVRQARRAGLGLADQVDSADDVLSRAGAAGHLRAVVFRAERGSPHVQLIAAGAPLLWLAPGDGAPATRLQFVHGPLLGDPGTRSPMTVDLREGGSVLALSDGVQAAGVLDGHGLQPVEIAAILSTSPGWDVPRTLLDEVRNREAGGVPDDATCLTIHRLPVTTPTS